MEAERGQTRIVGWHRVVLEVATHHLTQPPPLLRDRFVHTPLQFPFEGTQLGTHPVTARLAMKQEEAAVVRIYSIGTVDARVKPCGIIDP
jgi:hypothetical protein